ncbi:hypothetical protein B2J88_20205 [Rhodococcus sp. SRB_17]|uniref:hypothetical protein n=1 Tax=Acidovorax sp. SRB_24 TaxID=1962700 RepID=UPI00145ED857|nr:hypothetical protein [Acidovorax sp. SRB_24]NMM75374.1 hypothetical protein [Acidovorax sp. SRB_24]NMM86661.1 hypothetical protein [Rhodococcus sp. SRB_17]
MSRKTTLGHESLVLVTHLRAHGPSTAKTLLAQFPAEKRPDLLKRLSNLIAGGWLDFGWNSEGVQQWFVRPSARAALAVAVATPPATPNLVPPRRINVMAGTYTPPSFAPTRRGAMDFAAVASRGFSC